MTADQGKALMKKRDSQIQSKPMSFGDLINAVSSVSRNQEETVAAVADLLERGRVRILEGGHPQKARVI